MVKIARLYDRQCSIQVTRSISWLILSGEPLTPEVTANLLESIMPASSDPTSPDAQSLDSVEARMRRALGHAHETSTSENRKPDRLSGDRPRKRFVQDGDVAVTIVNRQGPRDQGSRDSGTLAMPEVSRISIVQKALANERSARERADRSLQEALATIHDLQTKCGHAELARREATASVDSLRADTQEREARLNDELAIERSARAGAEAALRTATLVREDAQDARRDATAAPKVKSASVPAKTVRKTDSKPREPQPVKWWLSNAKKR